LVSNQLIPIRRLCQRVAWMDRGKVRECGPTADIVGAYEASALTDSAPAEAKNSSRRAQFLRWELIGASGRQGNVLDCDGEVSLRYVVRVNAPLRNIHHGICLYNNSGDVVWGNCIEELDFERGVHEITCKLPCLPIQPGVYRWRISLYHGPEPVDDWEGVPHMLISTQPLNHNVEKWAGVLNIPSKFTIQRTANDAQATNAPVVESGPCR